MKITVLGLWHLGCVTAACVSKFAEVTGVDFDQDLIEHLDNAEPPIFEPGLVELIRTQQAAGRLVFDYRMPAEPDLLWICYDSPVDHLDRLDLTPVVLGLGKAEPYLKDNTLVVISSQIPAGTCRRLEKEYPRLRFAYLPENLRLGNAISLFLKADRIVLGSREHLEELCQFLKNFTENVIEMKTESAEMTKHAINCFLAMAISFTNEIAVICEHVGADAKEVEQGLRSESRIKGPLSPGGAFEGGTLARDVVSVVDLGIKHREVLALIPSIKESNDHHKLWSLQKLKEAFSDDLLGKRIALFGVTYKPGTDTVRRSLSVELCRHLLDYGAEVRVFDPMVPWFQNSFRTPEEAILGCDALVIGTQHPDFLFLDWATLLKDRPLVVDPSGFLAKVIPESTHYRRVGSVCANMK